MRALSSGGVGLVWLLAQAVAMNLAAAAPCDRDWTVGDPQWQTRGSIGCATRWDPDGDGPLAEVMVVGGSFSQIGDLQSIANVAVWDGVSWMPLGAGLGGQVRTLEVIDGSLYAGGSFAFSGLGQCRSIARWTGAAWEEFGGGATGDVYAIKKLNGEIVAGGTFTKIGGASIPYLARFSGGTWKPVVRNATSSVRVMEVYKNELYVGGTFTSFAGVGAANIARTDGIEWRRVDSGLFGTPTSMSADANELYVAGSILQAGPLATKNVAAWNGGAWRALPLDIKDVLQVRVDNGVLMAAGTKAVGGDFLSAVFRREGDGWSEKSDGFAATTSILPSSAVLTQRLGDALYVAGTFSVSGSRNENIARLDNGRWSALRIATNGDLSVGPSFRNGLVVFGSFMRIGNQETGPLALWNGGSFAPVPVDVVGSVLSTQVIDDVLYVSGTFESVAGKNIRSFFKWDGATVTGMDGALTSGAMGIVRDGSDPIIWGNFSIGGMNNKTIARWNGSEWIDIAANLAGTPARMVNYQGSLVATGATMAIAGKPVYVVRWTGSQWEELPGLTFNPRLGSIVEFNGELLCTGNVGGVTAIYRWTGSQWSRFDERSSGASFSLFVVDGELWATSGLVPDGWAGQAPALSRWTGTRWIGYRAPFSTATSGAGFGRRVFVTGVRSLIDSVLSVRAYAHLSAGPCRADFDCDGTVGTDDAEAFVAAFVAGDAGADRNEDGFLTFEDFDFFVGAFESGC